MRFNSDSLPYVQILTACFLLYRHFLPFIESNKNKKQTTNNNGVLMRGLQSALRDEPSLYPIQFSGRSLFQSLRPCSHYTGQLLRLHENHTRQGFLSHTNFKVVLAARFLWRREKAAAPISKVESHRQDRCSYHTRWLFESARKTIWQSVNVALIFGQRRFQISLTSK